MSDNTPPCTGRMLSESRHCACLLINGRHSHVLLCRAQVYVIHHTDCGMETFGKQLHHEHHRVVVPAITTHAPGNSCTVSPLQAKRDWPAGPLLAATSLLYFAASPIRREVLNFGWCHAADLTSRLNIAGNEDLKAKIKADLGVDAGDRDYLPFKGLEQSVKADVKSVKDSPVIDHSLPVYGYIYDVSPVEPL